MKCNYHTHSLYCDGKEPMEKFVVRAIEENFDILGFSSHAPIKRENSFGITMDNMEPYCNEIAELQERFPQIRLLKGLECDFIPQFSYDFNFFKEKYNLDYIIGGVHLVKPHHSDELWFIDGRDRQIYDNGLQHLFQNDIRKAVTAFWEQTFEMIETQKFDIIAHFDKIKMHNQNRFFKEDESWYRTLAEHAVELIKRNDLIVEINSRGLYKGRCDSFYPSDLLVDLAAKADIPFVISSDAHKSEELIFFYTEARQKLSEMGVRRLFYFDEGWKEELL